jgi:hypothetical protein
MSLVKVLTTYIEHGEQDRETAYRELTNAGLFETQILEALGTRSVGDRIMWMLLLPEPVAG